MKKLRDKLRGRSGETLTETLIALLVAAIALTMLAGMISATVNMVKTSEKKMDEYYKESWELEKISSGSSTPAPVDLELEIAGSGTNAPNVSISTNVKYYRNESFEKTPVIAYTRQSTSGTGETGGGG